MFSVAKWDSGLAMSCAPEFWRSDFTLSKKGFFAFVGESDLPDGQRPRIRV
jgi:hypothetical protein